MQWQSITPPKNIKGRPRAKIIHQLRNLQKHTKLCQSWSSPNLQVFILTRSDLCDNTARRLHYLGLNKLHPKLLISLEWPNMPPRVQVNSLPSPKQQIKSQLTPQISSHFSQSSPRSIKIFINQEVKAEIQRFRLLHWWTSFLTRLRWAWA